jgi:hypothetical protein
VRDASTAGVRRLGVALALACGLLTAAASAQLDSQYVLTRYALAIDAVPVPKNVVFTYTVSQIGPSNIDQRHTIFRSGADIRDETLSVDGITLSRKTVHFSKREDPYAVTHLAPRTVSNQVLFLRAFREGAHTAYEYEVTPLLRQPGATVYRMTIDGTRFLPRSVWFHTSSGRAKGEGQIVYAPFGRYWLPVLATVNANVNGKPARERITWGDYRFPETLPPSTFVPPKPLPPPGPLR